MIQTRLSDPRINAVTQKVLHAAKETLGDKLDKVILFGSYARGDFDRDSDIDIFCFGKIYKDWNISKAIFSCD